MVPVAEVEKANPERGAYRSSDGRPDCQICSTILLFAYETDTRKELTLGTAKDLLQSQCSHVALFKDWLHRLLTDIPARETSLLTIDTSYGRGWFSFMLSSSQGEDLGLLCDLTVPDHPGSMRVVDPQWVDVGLLKQWIKACTVTHGVRCRRSSWLSHLGTVRPKYLVDTFEMCIVEGESMGAGYIALSYQWGQTKTIRNTTAIRERLFKPSSLSDWDLARHIPQTINDAFAVVKLLGYRYLWVDALCVIQDDHVELAGEVSRMHRIYHSADFTIVAADGFDANYGLRGLKGLTASRNHSQVPTQLSESEWAAIPHPSRGYWQSQVPNTYHTRAWTFQEYAFSMRKLVFVDDAVQWSCDHGQMREDRMKQLPPKENSRTLTIHRLLATEMPTLYALGNLVSAYNSRHLTFPEDALSAFAGTQSLLEQFYQPGLLYGLPEFWFDLALCWIPNGNLVRRKIPRSRCSTGTSLHLPSWSWIGWTCRMRFPDDEIYEKGYWHERFTEPVTKWCTLAHPASPERRPINSSWHEYRSMALQGRLSTLPQGWDQQSDAKRGLVFSHTRCPRKKYSYPFPVPEPCSTSTSISVPQTAYLFAQTNRAFLCGQFVHNVKYRLMGAPHMWLKSSQDQYVGFIYLNSSEQESLLRETGRNSSSHNPLELVAMSKGTSWALRSPELDWEVELKRSAEASEREERRAFDCIFVLWIEWEDGVAYRRACGVVHADVWEREREKELVDLILG